MICCLPSTSSPKRKQCTKNAKPVENKDYNETYATVQHEMFSPSFSNISVSPRDMPSLQPILAEIHEKTYE